MYLYVLENYKGPKSRFTCPQCKGRKCFTKFVHVETGEYAGEEYGRCDKERKCGYLLVPKSNILDLEHLSSHIVNQKKQEQPPSLIPIEILNRSLAHYNCNNFATYLESLFGQQAVNLLLERYYIGTSKHWQGANIFWQIDINGNVRTGKIMLYDARTGKRVKDPFNHITWVHSILRIPNFHLKQCLFGAHLLNYDAAKTVAIVESEKTAIISSVFHPEFIWLACGSLSNLSGRLLEIVKDRKIVLFPDAGCYEIWKENVRKISSKLLITVSEILEHFATEEQKKEGYDLADFLVVRDPQTGLALKNGYPALWDF
jgi:hypothetical protein